MKVLAILFAVIVLMESTIQASCAGLQERPEDVCCSDRSLDACDPMPLANDTTTPDGQHETSDDCDSGCNPFKACACCKGANPIGNVLLLPLYADEDPTRHLSALFLPYADPLPDIYGVFPEHPPRIS